MQHAFLDPHPDAAVTTQVTTQLLRRPQAAAYLGLSASWLAKAAVYGGGPSFVKLGRKAVAYRMSDLDEFIANGIRRSTSFREGEKR